MPIIVQIGDDKSKPKKPTRRTGDQIVDDEFAFRRGLEQIFPEEDQQSLGREVIRAVSKVVKRFRNPEGK